MTPLFPYQETGADWLATRDKALLADPMGLGKSAQAIAACDRVNAATILVVCPASVRETWRREFDRFSAGQRVVNVLYKGQTPRSGAVNVASYEGADSTYFKQLLEMQFDVGIFDEAHYLKSPTAKRTKAVYGTATNQGLAHRCKHVWLLSGTPAPNNPIELYPHCKALFSEAFPRKSGKPLDKWSFQSRYCITRSTGFGEQIIGGKNLPELKTRLEPFVLRRKKEEVLKDLPPIRYEMLALDAGKLKLPADTEEWAKIALESSEPLKVLNSVAPHLVTLRRILGLAKVQALSDWITEQLDCGMEKLVVFAHHREVLDGLEKNLPKDSHFSRIDGSTNAKSRDDQVQEFQHNKDCRVFLGNLQAAGTGLTLTAACDMVFAEYSWVPAENQQAAMRIHRIGQKNSVLIRYACVAGSLDERIADVVRRKSADIKQVFA